MIFDDYNDHDGKIRWNNYPLSVDLWFDYIIWLFVIVKSLACDCISISSLPTHGYKSLCIINTHIRLYGRTLLGWVLWMKASAHGLQWSCHQNCAVRIFNVSEWDFGWKGSRSLEKNSFENGPGDQIQSNVRAISKRDMGWEGILILSVLNFVSLWLRTEPRSTQNLHFRAICVTLGLPSRCPIEVHFNLLSISESKESAASSSSSSSTLNTQMFRCFLT